MERTHLRYALPLADPGGNLSGHFGDAPYFALTRVRLADGAVEERQAVANPYLSEEKAKGIRVAEWLVARKADVVIVRESLRGKGPVYVFRDAGIELLQTAAATLDEALEAQQAGRS
jgi:predicted Fe-Mo cluster-binding NifX family protein